MEGLDRQAEYATIATCTYQTLFRYYDRLAGMTGTAMTEQEEFWDVYRLPVVAVPPNKQSRRGDLTPFWFVNQDARNMFVVSA